MINLFYILDGTTPRPVDAATCARALMDLPPYLARDRVGASIVTTIFLGVDCGYDGVPLLFETRIDGGPLDRLQTRYTTYDAALAGHAGVLTQLHAALD